MLHTNFLCLIVLGRLWRTRIQNAEGQARWVRRHREKARDYRRDYRKRPEVMRKKRVYRKARRDLVNASNRRWYNKASDKLDDSFIKHRIASETVRQTGVFISHKDIPDSVVRLKRETIHAKRQLYKEMGVRFSGIKG